MKLKLFFCSIIFLISASSHYAQHREAILWEHEEWSIVNNSFSGNPFDLVAKVRFVHVSGKHKHETEMFYAGDSIWKYRFTGTALGKWTYKTESVDPELDGITGTVVVKENSNPDIKGFLTHVGNQYAIWSGNQPELSAYWFNVYMDGVKFPSSVGGLNKKAYHESPFFNYRSTTHIKDYIQATKNVGFDIIFIIPGHPHVWTDGTTVGNGKNPRLETFDILDSLIIIAHNQGSLIHLWMWGDQQREATPIPLEGGINGLVDQRLQRYLAARLGPLPAWSMGYGFDLHEWTNTDELNKWASFMHEHMGWDHLLSARGYIIKGKNNINSYDGYGRKVPLTSSNAGPANFLEVLENMQSDTSMPHFYEERHIYLRKGHNLDMDGTRQLIWWNMMAGGMGCWFGFFDNSPYNEAKPYPNPEQIITAKRFWNNHFILGMKSIYHTDTPMLISPDEKKLIIYQEETDKVNLDFTKLQGKVFQAVAIDTKKEYKEIKLKGLKTSGKIWEAPYASDWVVIIEF